MLKNKGVVRLKIENEIQDKLLEDTPSILNSKFVQNCNIINKENESEKKNEEKRNKKDRKIKYIVKKVFEWRKRINGFYDENGKFVKDSLKEAADKVGLSKKSLDEYLTRIKTAREFEYDFNKNKDLSSSDLLKFVRENKSKKNSKTD